MTFKIYFLIKKAAYVYCRPWIFSLFGIRIKENSNPVVLEFILTRIFLHFGNSLLNILQYNVSIQQVH